MIVVGHQPQYIPYIAFFNKISKADVFVFVDNIQFNRKSWQQRTLIRCNNAPLYLTIPVSKKGKYDQLINEVEIIDDGWRKKHWKTIYLSYHKTPYFDLYKNDLEYFYSREWKYLSDFTSNLIKYFIDAIGIEFKKIYTGSELGIIGEKTNLLIDICRKTGCNTYLSGSGAKAYVDEQLLRDNNLKHVFNEFIPVTYKHYGNSSIDGLGIIDVMFMHGPKTIDIIKGHASND
jgi:hypothetical protein